MEKIIIYFRRVLFLGAFFFAGLAIIEKFLSIIGYTLLRNLYTPWRLLELSAITLLAVIALQLREIKNSLDSKNN